MVSNEHLKIVISNVKNENFDGKPPANISNGPSEELRHHSNTKTAAAHNHHLGHNGEDDNEDGDGDNDDADDADEEKSDDDQSNTETLDKESCDNDDGEEDDNEG